MKKFENSGLSSTNLSGIDFTMIERVREALRESPTWRGVLILSSFVLLLSLFGGYYFGTAAADHAIGKNINRMENLLDRLEKLTITQTQTVNMGGDRDRAIQENATRILQAKGLIDDD